MNKCQKCPKIVLDVKWDKVRANTEGWLFMKDGRVFCPDHIPAIFR